MTEEAYSLLSGDDFQDKYSKAVNIRFDRENICHCILRRHVATAKQNKLIRTHWELIGLLSIYIYIYIYIDIDI
jgi:hypothetical protein